MSDGVYWKEIQKKTEKKNSKKKKKLINDNKKEIFALKTKIKIDILFETRFRNKIACHCE